MGLFKKDPAMRKLKELTGGLGFTDYYDRKLKNAGLTIQDGYEIKEEVKKSIKRHEVKAEGVETRINFLIEERRKIKSKIPMNIDDETRIRLSAYIDRCEIDILSKDNLKKEVQDGKIKDMDTLISKIDEIKEVEYQKAIAKNKHHSKNESSSNVESQVNSAKSKPSESEVKSKIDEDYEVKVLTLDELLKMQKEDKIKEIKFLLNQEHNLLKCPSCGVDFLKGDKFCYNCGFDILKFIEDLNSGMVNFSNEEAEPIPDERDDVEKEIKSSTQDSNKESKLPSKKSTSSKQKSVVSAVTKRAINLKFASVVYLDEINRNPTKSVNAKQYKSRYNTTLAKIKKQAKEDGYIVDGTPLTAARGAYVKDLKKVLKKHGLMVSGTKDELIERLGENLTEEELKKAFPKKTLAVTDEGLEFIEKNKYVLYYDQTSQLRNQVPVEEFDSIFADAENLDEDKILGHIEKYLEESENL